jgi:hypothetical protein
LSAIAPRQNSYRRGHRISCEEPANRRQS